MSSRLAGARLFFVSAAVVLAAVNLASCAPKPYGNHTIQEVNALAEESGLVYESWIVLDTTGFPFEYRLNTSVTLSAAGSSPENLDAAVDYILRLVWAQTEADPMGVQSGSPGGDVDIIKPDGTYIDLCEFAQRTTENGDFECGGVENMLERLYGRWPGPVPELPERFSHIAGSGCETENPGPHGTYTCDTTEQIASEILGTNVSITETPNADPEKSDILVDVSELNPGSLDYLLRLAWSETSVEPTGDVVVFLPSFFGYEGKNYFYDDLDYDPPCEDRTPLGVSGIAFPGTCLEQLYGPWPGPLPEPPPLPTSAPAATVHPSP